MNELLSALPPRVTFASLAKDMLPWNQGPQAVTVAMQESDARTADVPRFPKTISVTVMLDRDVLARKLAAPIAREITVGTLA
jgi:hypothetical protein